MANAYNRVGGYFMVFQPFIQIFKVKDVLIDSLMEKHPPHDRSSCHSVMYVPRL